MNPPEPHSSQGPHEALDEASLLGALLLDGKGGGHPLKWKGIHSWKKEDGALWIHLDRKAPDARKWLRKGSGLDPLICEALLAEETRPRAEGIGDGMLVILRGVNLNPGEAPDDMISVRIWIERNRIITLRGPKLLALADVRKRLDAGTGPDTAAGVLVSITEMLTDRMGPVMENLNDIVDAIEEKVLANPDAALRRELSEMRRQAISLRRHIAPQREAILRLQSVPGEFFAPEHLMRLRESGDRTTRYVEDLDALRERASVVVEEITARASEQINRTMYALSLVAGIFLPLGFVTGLLGINVGGMPGVDNAGAFSIVCLILAAMALGLLLVFRRMKLF
ncbi:MAG: zinc transporter ZntB [Oceanipulchritudo sp.]